MSLLFSMPPAARVVLPIFQRQKLLFFGTCLLAFLVPRTHVPPPTWWQCGWRRQNVANGAQVELLSQLGAVLMPKTSIAELFRSFPSPNRLGEEPLEPDLSAYGVFRDHNAVMFVLHDQSHEKREAVSVDRKMAALLAYGPPGSHVLHICHGDPSRELKDRRLICVKVGSWVTGEKMTQSEILRDLLQQISLEVGQLLSADVLERMRIHRQTSLMNVSKEAEDFTKMAMTLNKLENVEETKNYLAAEGFSEASIGRMQKFVRLIGFSTEMSLQSRMQQLLDMHQSEANIAEAIATFAPSLGRNIKQNLHGTAQWLLEQGLVEDQVMTAVRTLPEFLSCRTRQNLRPTVQWLLGIGLTQAQVAKTIGASPQTAQADQESTTWNLTPTVQWLLNLGLTRKQLLKAIAVYPAIVACCPEWDLEPKVQWLLEMGLSKGQIVQMIAAFPAFLGHCCEDSLKPKMQWLSDLGLRQSQIVKVITSFPQTLGCSLEKNLKPTAQWLLDLGLNQGEVAKIIARSPSTLGCSLENKLKPTVRWLTELGMNQVQIAKILTRSPQILQFSIEENLKPTVRSLVDFGLNEAHVSLIGEGDCFKVVCFN